MEDGTDRARRDTAGRINGRRAALHDSEVDDVLARHGLLGGPSTGGRRRRPDTDDEPRRDQRRSEPRSNGALRPTNGHAINGSRSGSDLAPPRRGPHGPAPTGGRRHRPDDQPPAFPTSPDRPGGRRRRPDPDEPAPGTESSGRRRRPDGEPWRPPVPGPTGSGGRRYRTDDEPAASSSGRHGWPRPDAPADPARTSWTATSPGRRHAGPEPPGPPTASPGGRRHRPDPDLPPPGAASTGGRRAAAPERPTPSGRRHRPGPPPAPAPGGGRHRPEPDDAPPPGGRLAPEPPPGGRAPRPGDRPGRHSPPGPHVAELGAERGAERGARSAGGTGNFLDASTPQGRAALETSGALERTSAVAPGWVRANDKHSAEATTKLRARTSRDTAPTAKVPLRIPGLRPGPRRGETVDGPTTALRARGGSEPPPRPADGRADGRAPQQREDPDEHEAPKDQDEGVRRIAHIDETLTRLTAAHAGVKLASDPDDEEEEEPRPRLTPLRLLCLALAVVVLGAAGVGYATRAWLSAAVPTVAALDLKSSAIVDAAAQKDAMNVLVVAAEHETVPGTAPRSSATFAIAHVPADGGDMTVLSLPAELEINRPPCERYDPISRQYTTSLVPAEARTQLVSALSVGGPRCITRVVQQLTGLAITGYVGVDLDELAQLVDTVGGVGICLTRPVVDAALGPIVSAAGEQELGGDRALDYLRAREVTGDPPSGAGRVERQQGVLAAALGPLLSTTGLLDIGRLAAARPVVGRAITVDELDLDQVHATARSLHKLDAEGVRFVTVPTMTGPSGSGVVLRDAEAAELFAAVRGDRPLPESATTATATGPQPGDAPVQVLNASDRPGLANQVGDTLRQLGFAVGETGNAAQRTTQTIVRYSPDREAAARLVATSVPSANLVPDPGSHGVLQLVLGRSFDDVVRPPTSSAPPTGTDATLSSTQCR
ncbi:transcriptional attenuator, LytR family [Pseudonocardia thermophila]|uniref:Transcriptional attenuator, LytR family n=1 Tax=Pseudonocardia thermophila TaxID=1848 RepID=A0A1M6SAG0_PSETH|nr:LCP family protein [Pseudonocardia thermophila]SHK41711.1 transcriptional attenuator, LytR family [Pseudonocardia thermophila]